MDELNGQSIKSKDVASDVKDNNSSNDDLLSRVSNYKPKENTTKPDNKEVMFNPMDFDNIDSVESAKEYAQKAYKSFESGYQRKFQEIAELKKALEAQVSKSNGKSEWTTQDIQDLMQNQSFLQAAQGIIQSQDQNNNSSYDDDYSNLSDKDKQEIAEIKKQNAILLQQQNMFFQKQQDEMLKSKYPNYNQEAVDTITGELLKGKVKNTREYIWRAFDYEDAVKRAYDMGRTDERQGINENVNAASYEGTSTTTSAGVKRDKNESGQAFMRRLYSVALKSSRSK